MTIEWTPHLAVGHEEIDRQHRELLRRANEILDAMTEGRGLEEVDRTVAFLAEYVAHHFKTEERQMALLAYPGITAHKAEHAAFVTQMLRLRDEFRAGGPTMPLAVELQRLVCALVGDHFLRTDQALATFLRKADRR
jgi:hemerythrin-like metal-binding protein